MSPDACDVSSQSPILGLVFLHNRKSGGTHVLHFLSQWLRKYGCLDGFDEKTDVEGFENINGGMIYRRTPPVGVIKNREGRAKCPFVEMYHNEFYCISGDMIINYPASDQLNHTKLRFLTTIRDPIERIGSQFFHTPVCYGRRHIIQTVHRTCGTMRKHLGACRIEEQRGFPQSDLCKCVILATKLAFENLKQNESVWFDWLLHSEQGFLEQHMNNYYIKRLASVRLQENRPRHKNLVNSDKCLRGLHDCRVRSPHLMLQHTASFHPCPITAVDKPHLDKDALAVSKTLLQDHFYFFVMEFYEDKNSVKNVLNGIFDDNIVYNMVDKGEWSLDTKTSRMGHLSILASEISDITKNNGINKKQDHVANQHNPSAFTEKIEVGMYQRLMPEAVVQHIYEQNKEDYELYFFARRQYLRRFGS